MQISEVWKRMQEEWEKRQEKLRKQATKDLFKNADRIFASDLPVETKLQHIQRLLEELRPILLGGKK